MKKTPMVLGRLRGLSQALLRFPLTAAFLLLAAALNAGAIQTHASYTNELWACAVGAMLGALAQVIFERFFRSGGARLALYAAAIGLALGYFLMAEGLPMVRTELSTRTVVMLTALFSAFLWVPVIQSRLTFSESFLAAFKGFFHAALYAGVLFGGCALVAAALDNLIVPLNFPVYAHIANIVFLLFAPLFFLSLIPVYPGSADAETEQQSEAVSRAVSCPRFLEVLISYIVIPLTAAFTVILVLYIVLNIRGDFWTNNLLEPLLLSYAVTVLTVTLLAGRMENRFAAAFRRVFSKVLLPIVLFQLAASLLRLRDAGLTHDRYFILVFGLFSAGAGIVLGFLPQRKHGLVALLLILFAAVSVTPPVDAFTLSRRSQIDRLEQVLSRNNMLQQNTVVPNTTLSTGDKERIVSSVQYLSLLGYTSRVPFLPADFDMYEDFHSTFGFSPYGLEPGLSKWVSVSLAPDASLDISGYHALVHTALSTEQSDQELSRIVHNGSAYLLRLETRDTISDLVLATEEGRELLRFSCRQLLDRYASYSESRTDLSAQEAFFAVSDNQAGLAVIVQSANLQRSSDGGYEYYYAVVTVLLRFP